MACEEVAKQDLCGGDGAVDAGMYINPDSFLCYLTGAHKGGA